MDKLTKQALDGYVKWLLYVRDTIEINKENSKQILRSSFMLTISLIYLKLTNKNIKKEDIFYIFQSILTSNKNINTIQALRLTQDYNELAQALQPLVPKEEENDIDEILSQVLRENDPTNGHQA